MLNIFIYHWIFSVTATIMQRVTPSMENANACQDSLELDVKNFVKKGIGDKIATNHANAIAQISFVIQLMVVFADPAIEVKINQSSLYVSKNKSFWHSFAMKI